MMSSATSKIVESTKNQGIQLNLTNTTNSSSKFVNLLHTCECRIVQCDS